MQAILYSLHNCPYAIRTRWAILKAQRQVLLHSIKLDNKPPELLRASPKGEVPVLVVTDWQSTIDSPTNSEANQTRQVYEQSLDIMLWALTSNDPNNLLLSDEPQALLHMQQLINEFELRFIPAMNAFGCAKRYHEQNLEQLRAKCEVELNKLEQRLQQHEFLFCEQESLVDIALIPFIRKYARIDKAWFRQCRYTRLRTWLKRYMDSPQFSMVMKNYDLWQQGSKPNCFG